jgi:hypothetical protein
MTDVFQFHRVRHHSAVPRGVRSHLEARSHTRTVEAQSEPQHCKIARSGAQECSLNVLAAIFSRLRVIFSQPH